MSIKINKAYIPSSRAQGFSNTPQTRNHPVEKGIIKKLLIARAESAYLAQFVNYAQPESSSSSSASQSSSSSSSFSSLSQSSSSSSSSFSSLSQSSSSSSSSTERLREARFYEKGAYAVRDSDLLQIDGLRGIGLAPEYVDLLIQDTNKTFLRTMRRLEKEYQDVDFTPKACEM